MAIVPPSQDSNQPRVLPKVFADVPSAAEIAAAQQEVAQARGGRRSMSLLVVLLLGMLIAAGAGAVYLQQQNAAFPPQIDKLTEEKAELEESLADAQAQIDEIRAANADAIEEYTVIAARLERNDGIRDEIRKALESKKGAANLYRPPLGSDDGDTPLDRPRWPDVQANAIDALKAETAELEQIKARIDGWTPPVKGIR